MTKYPHKKTSELTTEQRIQLASVATMNVPMLRQKYREVFGEESTSHNAAYLRKRIVWRMQEKVLGGLSERARQRLVELGREAPFRYRGGPLASFSVAADRLTDSTLVASTPPAQALPEASPPAPDLTQPSLPPAAPALRPAAPQPASSQGAAAAASPGHLQLATTPVGPTEQRDRRLPPPGALIKKVYDGLTHNVQVLPAGFLYNGQPYASLSKLARVITGSNWNGFTFFGLTRPWKSEDAA